MKMYLLSYFCIIDEHLNVFYGNTRRMLVRDPFASHLMNIQIEIKIE